MNNDTVSAPAQPRDAATVVILRDGAHGLELYLVKRSRTVDFMAGAHVFPGGRLDKADSSPSTCALLSSEASDLHARLGEALEAAAARRPPPVLMPLVWNEDGRAYISLPGDPRHAMPDVLGGRIFRIQLQEGRYRAVKAS
jgi:hypothetical protein